MLSIETRGLDRLFEVVEASTMPANMFIKHLVILADFSGEMLQRVSREHETIFPDGKLSYYWQGEQQIYSFRAFPVRRFSNTNLKIDGKELFMDHPLDDLQKDVIALLLFGSAYSDNDEITTTLARCEIGNYLGKPDELESF